LSCGIEPFVRFDKTIDLLEMKLASVFTPGFFIWRSQWRKYGEANGVNMAKPMA